MYCPKCGSKLNDDAVFCANCGSKIESAKESPKQVAQANDRDQPASSVSHADSRPAKTYNGQIVASFVLGIMSILFWSIPLIDLAMAIVGIVLNRKSDISLNFGLRKAGFVLCLLGIIFGAMWTIFMIIYLAYFSTVLSIFF